MYQNLINSLKKILESKATQQEKLLKISTLVDFADGLDRPTPIQYPPTIPPAQPIQMDMNNITVKTEQKPNMIDAKSPTGPGALVGVEDIK